MGKTSRFFKRSQFVNLAMCSKCGTVAEVNKGHETLKFHLDRWNHRCEIIMKGRRIPRKPISGYRERRLRSDFVPSPSEPPLP